MIKYQNIYHIYYIYTINIYHKIELLLVIYLNCSCFNKNVIYFLRTQRIYNLHNHYVPIKLYINLIY